MCRGFVENERETLKAKAFYTNLSVKNATNLPDFLTLHYPTRINGTFLEIDGSNIRPDSPAFVTLHRILSEEEASGVTYGSREKAVVCEGAKFEIYVGDVKVLKGIFRKDEGDCWKIDCKCVLAENDAVKGIEGVEVSVATEGTAEVMTEKVEIVAARRRRRRRSCDLEEIPEEREREREGEFVSGVCWCSECGGKENIDGGDCEMEVEMEEGVHWAVDVGIWVVCFGVGYLVSRASSSRRFRSKRKLIWN
ncbi:hypothetical protein ACS0TY_011166 [Phlomoides rotata]